MTGPITAPVRRILKGHSDRALIHAVDASGLEYKIEAPLAAVQGIGSNQTPILVVSWSLQVVPSDSPPSSGSSATASAPRDVARPAPDAVDQAFMELMGRSSTAPSIASPNPTSTNSTSGAVQELVALLGNRVGDERRQP